MLLTHYMDLNKNRTGKPLLSVFAGKGARLKGFEFPKAVHLDSENFSIDHDLITPKMSLKRPQLLKYYKANVCYCCNHV